MLRLHKQYLSWYSILHVLLIFVLVLNCHSVYDAGVIDYHFDIVSCVLAMLLFLAGKKIDRRSIFLMLFYLIYQIPLIINTAINSDYIVTYMFKYVAFLSLIILLSFQNREFLNDSIKYFIDIIYCIAVLSLLFFALSNMLHLLRPTGRYMLLWTPHRLVNSYFGIYFDVSRSNYIFDWKNSAIFTEAPVWASLLVVAISLELFYKKEGETRKKYILVLYITLLTTLSTTAYIFFLLSLVGFIYVSFDRRGMPAWIKVFLVFIFAASVVFAVVFAINILVNKSLRGISFLTRADDLMVGLKALRDHPIFGVGFGTSGYRKSYFSNKRVSGGDMGQSSDISALLAAGGLYFIVVYLIGIVGFAKMESKKRWLILVGLFLYILTISRLGETLLLLTFVFCGLTKLLQRKQGCCDG